MRVTLDFDEANELMVMITDEMAAKNPLLRSVRQKLHEENIKPVPKSKKMATRAATRKRQSEARKAIENAVNTLKLYGKDVTPYKVAKESGVSYNTAKKYLK